MKKLGERDDEGDDERVSEWSKAKTIFSGCRTTYEHKKHRSLGYTHKQSSTRASWPKGHLRAFYKNSAPKQTEHLGKES